MKEEIWAKIPGFNERYEVSNKGRVKSKKTRLKSSRTREQEEVSRILKQNPNTKGYLLVGLSIGGITKTKPVHRLVAEAFLPPIDGKNQVNHKDGNKKNNNTENLEWTTISENMKHATENGLRSRGSSVHCAKLHEKDVPVIRHKISIGQSLGSISREYGVDRRQIWAIREYRAWKHIK